MAVLDGQGVGLLVEPCRQQVDGRSQAALLDVAAGHEVLGLVAQFVSRLQVQSRGEQHPGRGEVGLGLALLPCFLGDTSPELVRVIGPLDELETGLWLLTHEDLRRTARVRALLDFLFEELKSQRPLLQGEKPRKA